MEALENPILCCTYGAQCRKKKIYVFSWDSYEHYNLILSLLYGLTTYSSIRNRRACMFINFEKKFPPCTFIWVTLKFEIKSSKLKNAESLC